jgi:aspartyl-tRNA(Asn)/glutamyl-tRNA(Gln) amidotransferase subunit A
VRVPAAWNDLVGLKTTSGRLPLTGVVPLCERFDTIGPLARTVEDCAALLAAMEGHKPADLTGGSLAGKRFLLMETVALDDIRDAPARAFDAAVARLAAKGAHITSAKTPLVATAMQTAARLFAAEAYGTWRDVIEAAPEKMFPLILERFRSGGDVMAADFVANWRKLDALRREWYTLVADYDAVILPTSPIMPPNAKRLLTDDAYFNSENLLALRNTRIGNVLGGAVLTLPTGHASCGISLMLPPHQENRLLQLGQAAEFALL